LFSLFLNVEEAERDLLVAELWDAGATGITEEPHALRAFFSPEVNAKILLRQFADFKPSVQEEEDRDWVRFAQDQWQPFPVGERFYLVPEWRDDPAPEGRLRLLMHPGMACGSGTHAATRLCLMAMERHIRPGQSVIDVGTGAGILADAARLLGAKPVFACDIEHDSARVARNNLENAIGIFTGSARSVRSSAVNWAVCNLNSATLSTLKPELNRISAGLILSGFEDDEISKIIASFRRQVIEELELDGYGCIVMSGATAK
jgi:ribosomal protein L11 methyltransferase